MHQSNLGERHYYGYCLLFIISVKQSYRLLSLCIFYKIWLIGASLIAQLVKNLPAVQKTQGGSLGQEGPLEKEMATHSSILAWKIPWIEEPGGLQSMGLQIVRHN